MHLFLAFSIIKVGIVRMGAFSKVVKVFASVSEVIHIGFGGAPVLV